MYSNRPFHLKTALPKTAIIGSTGFIGRALFSKHREVHPDCIGTTRDKGRADLRYLDLLSCDIAPLKLAESGHRDAIIAAGIARIFVCEREKDYSNKMTRGTLELVKQLVNEGIKPVYISSDSVFDGHVGNYEDEVATNPLNEYGKQKAEIEKGIQEIAKGKYLIARFSKVFTLQKGDGTIFDEMASVLTSGKTIRAAYDQIFSPTLLSDSVNALKILQMNDATGIVNISSPEVWSRYDLALKMADYLGVNPKAVERVSLDDLHEILVRPKNASLNTKRLFKETQYQFTPITQCMEIIANAWKAPQYEQNGLTSR